MGFLNTHQKRKCGSGKKIFPTPGKGIISWDLLWKKIQTPNLPLR
jgi:hypothetical protein